MANGHQALCSLPPAHPNLCRLLPERGCPACHLAAQARQSGVEHKRVQSFLERYSFRSATDKVATGLTPLMMACIEGCKSIVQQIFSFEAEVNERTEVVIADIQVAGKHSALTISALLSSSKAGAAFA